MASHPVNEQMTDEQFDHYAMSILARELGPGGLARFISLHRSGSGDYTRDRHRWLAGATLEDIAREMGIELPT
jgi:hypothetical protein